jgi:hypothetical protein
MSVEIAMPHQADWTTLVRFDDPVEAEVTLNFLVDHGVRAALEGPIGSTSPLDRLSAVVAIRLVVPPSEVDRAHEVLEAMNTPNAEAVNEPPAGPHENAAAAPYRGGAPGDIEEESSRRRRYRVGPLVLAFLPSFGAGHFYARHNRSGLLFGASILAFLITGIYCSVGYLAVAALFVMLADACLGVRAVRRFNEGRVASDGRQTITAAVVIAASVLAALAFVHLRPRRSTELPQGSDLPARGY